MQFFINLNQNTTLHTFNICSIHLRIDNNAPMYALGDTAWTRGRIFSKFFIKFYGFINVCHFDNCPSIRIKTQRCTPSMCSISLWIDNSTLMYALGDTAWTRGQIFAKILSHFMNLQKSVTLTILIDLIQNTTLHTFNMCFICIRMDNNAPLYTFGDTAWTRGWIFPKIS